MANGGRGLKLIDLEAKDTLAGAAAYTRSMRIDGIGRGGKERDETLEIRSLNNAMAGTRPQGQGGRSGLQAEQGHAGVARPPRLRRAQRSNASR
jgi:topoisomerase-4 subunit A